MSVKVKNCTCFSILRFVAGYDNGGQGKLIEVRKSGVEYEEFLEQMEGACS